MEKKLTSSDFFWAFVRSNFLQGSWNMERMQALGYCFGMIPIIKRLYEGEERKQALKRHLEFYNTQPFVTAPIILSKWFKLVMNVYCVHVLMMLNFSLTKTARNLLSTVKMV